MPTSTEINGTTYDIRSDYRAVLDIMQVLSDVSLSDRERGAFACEIFYPAFDAMPRANYKQAAEYLMWFIGGGDTPRGKSHAKLADWTQDFPLIINPVNRVLGFEARAVDYLHWWTFLGAYCEIGDCLFAQVVSIRKKLKRGKKLEKHEREFYRENRDIVDFKTVYTDADEEFFSLFSGNKQ